MVGSLEEVKVGNKTVRARQYPWGVVQGKDPSLEEVMFSSAHSLKRVLELLLRLILAVV